MSETLKPCPFCGVVPNPRHQTPERIARGHMPVIVYCFTEGCPLGNLCDRPFTPDEWNRRTPGPATAKMRLFAKSVVACDQWSPATQEMFAGFLRETDSPTQKVPANRGGEEAS